MADDRQKRHLSQILDALMGALLATVAAIVVSIVAIGHTWEVSVPLIFIAILLVISVVFGARAGVIGTLLAALIFVLLLFHSLGKPQVGNDAARANLAWMLLLGISFSFLFAPSNSSFRRR